MCKDTFKVTKRAMLFLSFLFLMLLSINNVNADNEINIFIDGKALVFNTTPIIIEGTTMVPLRDIAEGLSMEVQWNNETRTIICIKDGSEINLQIDSNIAFVNGVEKYVDIAPLITNERTLLPLRFISANFGCEVNWDGDTKTIQIFSKPALSIDKRVVKRNIANSYNQMIDYYLHFVLLKGTYKGIDAINEYYYLKEKNYFFGEKYNNWFNSPYPNKDHYYLLADYHLEVQFGYIISISGDVNSWAGGVNNPTIYGDVFDLRTGKKLTLSDIFKVGKDEYLSLIYDEVSKSINKEIARGFNRYNFADAASKDGRAAIEKFEPENFYLTGDSLVVFYPKYSLGAGAAGTFSFEIPLDWIKDKLKINISDKLYERDNYVQLKDKTIEAAVRKLLNKPSGGILMSDLRTITDLGFSTNTKPAVILDDLVYMKNLESLSAGRNSIVDIRPLSGLTKLFYVYLGNNKIRDLSPLASLENLTVLFVAGDGRVQEYTDISFLNSLSNLKKLEICTSTVSDLSPLYGLESIRELSIISTQPIDIAPFKKLPNLIELKINNKVIDLSTVE